MLYAVSSTDPWRNTLDESKRAAWASAAKQAVAKGYRVFPYGESKADILCKWGAEATRSPRQIDAWAARFPRSKGYGIALDADTYVFDADNQGCVDWCRANLPPTLVVSTGRAEGGAHFYLRVPKGRRLRMLNTRLGPLVAGMQGLDGKTRGGYVVGPGSRHSSGTTYDIVDDLPVADMPPALADLIGDRVAAIVESDDGLGAAELAVFEANAAWGAVLRPEALRDIRRAQLDLVSALSGADAHWPTLFLHAATRMGAWIHPGAVSYAELVTLLDGIFDEHDTWRLASTNVHRSIRRGLAYGARTEADAAL